MAPVGQAPVFAHMQNHLSLTAAIAVNFIFNYKTAASKWSGCLFLCPYLHNISYATLFYLWRQREKSTSSPTSAWCKAVALPDIRAKFLFESRAKQVSYLPLK
jgi:hypothetical protein